MKTKMAIRNEAREALASGIQDGTLNLAQALKLARKVLNKNQAEYAKLVGITKKAIADLEVNKGNPTVATLNKIFSPVGLQVSLKAKDLAY
jgi:DNA-binding XRE family transcriptional regulator